MDIIALESIGHVSMSVIGRIAMTTLLSGMRIEKYEVINLWINL